MHKTVAWTEQYTNRTVYHTHSAWPSQMHVFHTGAVRCGMVLHDLGDGVVSTSSYETKIMTKNPISENQVKTGIAGGMSKSSDRTLNQVNGLQ